MSLVIAHMQKNRKYSSITCHMFNSLYTHGINWEWLWVRNYEHTHRPTHRVASGINSVMGLKNKKQKTGRRNTENTNTIFCPFKSSSSHRNATLRSSWMFSCVLPSRPRVGTTARRFPVTKTKQKKATSVTRWQAAASRWWWPPVIAGESGPLRQPCSCRLALQFYPKHIKNIDWSNRTSGWWIFNLGNPKRCESVLFGHVRRDVQLLI